MFDLARSVLAIRQPTLRATVEHLQREAMRLTLSTEAICTIVDWSTNASWTMRGRNEPAVHDLVTEVASTGQRKVVGSAVLAPAGRGAVLAVRRLSPYSVTEIATLEAFARGIAPVLDDF